MFRTLRWRLVPLWILVAILAIPLIEHWQQLHHVSQLARNVAETPAAPPTQSISGIPVRIVVPNAAIDLSIVPGAQDLRTHAWSVASKQANYATNTAPANNREGKTFIYGHNNHYVFKSLLGLKPGEQAIIYTANNHIFTYTFTAAQDVSPQQGSIFTAMRHGTGLVLMTCDGDHFEYRHLMNFKLNKAT